jgi:LPS export ABC transporter protein LptC
MRRALILLGVLLAGCADPDTPPATESEGSGLEREIKGFRLSETQEGHPVWELRASTAWRVPRDTQLHLNDVEVVFFDREGGQDSRLTARRGVVEESTGLMTAKDDVRLVSVRGDTLTTQELSYLKDQDLIRGPGWVRLAKPDRVLTGSEFEAKPDLTTYEIRRDVHITLVGDRRADAP